MVYSLPFPLTMEIPSAAFPVGHLIMGTTPRVAHTEKRPSAIESISDVISSAGIEEILEGRREE